MTTPQKKMSSYYLPEELHRKFKVAAAIEGKPMHKIIESFIEAYVKKMSERYDLGETK